MTIKRTCIILPAIILLLLLNTVQLKAQGLPCGDPDVECPIDGYVILLVIAILFLSVKKITDAKLALKQAVKEV